MKRNQKMTSGNSEVALFPMEHLQVTQGRYSNLTHVGYNATDLSGKDRGINPLFAPFTLKVR